MLNRALGEELLHVPVAQGEPEVEPDGVPDHLGREAVAVVGDRLHGPFYRSQPPVRLTRQCPPDRWRPRTRLPSLRTPAGRSFKPVPVLPTSARSKPISSTAGIR